MASALGATLTEEAFFRQHVPVTLRRAVTRAVLGGCVKAYQEAQERDKDFLVDAIPHLRRLRVEPALAKLILPKGFSSEIRRTPSSSYTQISTDRVVITAVTRADDVRWVEPYRYRETLARGPQLDMFEEGREIVDSSRKLYALLIYGGPHSARLPTLARFVFPDPTGNILSDGVNLLVEHAEIVASYTEVLDRAEGAKPTLRKTKGEEEN
jgi:hypothetical protein